MTTPVNFRATPPPPKKKFKGWLATEWGLVALAGVLAVLVWAVVWGGIAEEDSIRMRLEPRTSSLFVAYAAGDGRVDLKLKGPARDLEEALRFNDDPVVANIPNVEKLLEGKDQAEVFIGEADQLSLPFPQRLVADMTGQRVQVYRLSNYTVRFEKLQILNRPPGVEVEVSLEPEGFDVRGPRKEIGITIKPDPVDVSRFFEETEGGMPEEETAVVFFNNWRDRAEEHPCRRDVVLPKVTATLRFTVVGSTELKNPIRFEHADGFIVIPSSGAPVAPGNFYTGTFKGPEADLKRLEENSDSWWYVVRVPKEKLPSGDVPEPASLPIEYFHAASLDDLDVEFVPTPPTLVIEIKRAP